MTSFINFICRQTLWIALAAFLCTAAAEAQPSLPTVRTDRSSARSVIAGGRAWGVSGRSFMPEQTGRMDGRISDVRSVDDIGPVSEGADTRLFRKVNDAQTPFKTSLFTLTDNSVAVLVVGVPLGFIVYGLAADDRNAVTTGVLLSATEVLAYGVKHVLKVTIKRPRPYEELGGVHVNNLESADEYSFPSGHTTGAFALATMLTLRYPKPAVYIPAFIWAGLVGYGRVYNGVHYPSDVLGGMAVGAGSAVLTYALRGPLIDAFDRVTGRKSDGESSFLIMPQPDGAAACVSIRF